MTVRWSKSWGRRTAFSTRMMSPVKVHPATHKNKQTNKDVLWAGNSSPKPSFWDILRVKKPLVFWKIPVTCWTSIRKKEVWLVGLVFQNPWMAFLGESIFSWTWSHSKKKQVSWPSKHPFSGAYVFFFERVDSHIYQWWNWYLYLPSLKLT